MSLRGRRPPLSPWRARWSATRPCAPANQSGLAARVRRRRPGLRPKPRGRPSWTTRPRRGPAERSCTTRSISTYVPTLPGHADWALGAKPRASGVRHPAETHRGGEASNGITWVRLQRRQRISTPPRTILAMSAPQLQRQASAVGAVGRTRGSGWGMAVVIASDTAGKPGMA